MQKGGYQLPIHRSHSVPVLNKDGSMKQMDSIYRVFTTTPKVTEQTAATSVPGATIGTGTFM